MSPYAYFKNLALHSVLKLSSILLFKLYPKVVARGRRCGKTDADNSPEAAVQLTGGQVRQPGAVLDVGAPGAARGVPQGGVEGAGLRHQDDRGAQREAQLADQHELHAEPADGESGRHEVRGPHHEGRGGRGARARAGDDTGAHGKQLGARIQGERGFFNGVRVQEWAKEWTQG